MGIRADEARPETAAENIPNLPNESSEKPRGFSRGFFVYIVWTHKQIHEQFPDEFTHFQNFMGKSTEKFTDKSTETSTDTEHFAEKTHRRIH